MSRTITALFDTRADADAGAERLKQAGVDASHVSVHDETTHKTAGAYSDHKDQGMWASVKNALLPDEDRHAYEEGVRRGGFVLSADVADEHTDAAVKALEEANSVDLDDRSAQWRQDGWDYPAAGAATAAAGTGLFGGTPKTDTNVGEEMVPIVEEQLVVGKREVERGGVRVRSYVTEVPVHEQVRLRDERISVERRAVNKPLSAADGDAFRERTVEMTATGEEAVVGKTAHVVEEVVVSKTSDERVEQIDDKVRKTEVEIDRDATSSTKRGI